jgi:transposase
VPRGDSSQADADHGRPTTGGPPHGHAGRVSRRRHRRRHPPRHLTAAAVTNLGGVLAPTTTSADVAGDQQLLGFGHRHLPGRRCWAVEGAGSFGVGLTAVLQQRGEWVVEVGRPKRPASRSGAKSDALDAVRAAREVLGHARPAIPRRRGEREALRALLTTRRSATTARVAAVGQLKALIVGAPEELRAELRGQPTSRQVAYWARLRERPSRTLEHRATIRALRATAQRIQFLHAEAEQLQAELTVLVAAVAPWLLEVPGVGALSAAQVLVSWSQPAGSAPRRPCRPGRHQPDPGLLWAGDPLPAQPRR